jgi:transposase-like protein
MGKQQDKGLTLAAAQRGQVVQRVLVDGWTVRQAAGAFGLDDRSVARWVRAYRRRGMASLRGEGTASERAWRRLLIALQRRVPQASAAIWQLIGRAEPAPCVELRRGRDDALRR